MAGAASPQLTRLDAILALVQEQEEHRREQDLRIAELAQRLADAELHSAQQLAPLHALKVRAPALLYIAAPCALFGDLATRRTPRSRLHRALHLPQLPLRPHPVTGDRVTQPARPSVHPPNLPANQLPACTRAHILQERDVPRELDMARAAVESLVRQVATLNRAQQAAAADAARAAARRQAWEEGAAGGLAALREELEALRCGLGDAREGADAALSACRQRLEQQLQAHREAVDEAVQVGPRQAGVLKGAGSATAHLGW
jgi:hypothetical protein